MLFMAVTASHCIADPAAFERAVTLVNARQYELAAVEFKQLAEDAQPDSAEWADAKFQLGYCQQNLKQLEAAHASYQAALACKEISTETRLKAWTEIGYTLRRLNREEEALDYLERVIESEHASPRARSVAALYVSSTLEKLGRTKDAIEQLKFITGQKETLSYYRASAWVSLGRTYTRGKDFAAAREAYQAALAEGENGLKTAAAHTGLMEVELLSQPDTPLFIKPWPVSVSANTATLHWVAKGDLDEAQVTVEDDGVKISTSRVEEIEPGFFLYASRLSGLTSGKIYRYQVSGSNDKTEGSFITPPAEDVSAVTFCVLGDTQSRSSVHTAIAKRLAEQKPEFVLHAGDCVENGQNWLQWQTQVFIPGRPYLQQAPLYPARGNHDTGSYFPRLFGLTERQYYSFDYGMVHVAAIAAFGPDSSRDARQRQVQWLDRDLAETSAPWKIIILHDPMVNEDLRNDWFGLEDFMPLVEKHHVAVVFSGHHHCYRRFMPLHPPGQPSAGGTWHITTGGSGGTLSSEDTSPLMVKKELVHHFVRVDVSPEKMRMTAIDRQGGLVDAMELKLNAKKRVTSDVETPVDRAVAEQVITFFTSLTRFKLPEQMNAVREGNEIVVDFATLPQGALDTSEYPRDFQVRVEAGSNCQWEIKPQWLEIRGRQELRFVAQPPEKSSAPLEITLTPKLGDQLLTPHTIKVSLEDI